MNRFARLIIATAVALPLAAGAALCARADTVAFILRNNDVKTLLRFFASPTYLDGWESDVLGSRVVYSGYQVSVTFNNDRSTCYYDFLFVFSDGSKVIRRNVNVCNLSAFMVR
jgi:hypothetical protein